MENIKNFENSKFCYPGGWSTCGLGHARIREGHRTSGYSFVKHWRTKFMLLLRRNSDTIKAFCCGINCGIAISKCTGYYTRKCVSAQTTRKHKFHGNSMELSWE